MERGERRSGVPDGVDPWLRRVRAAGCKRKRNHNVDNLGATIVGVGNQTPLTLQLSTHAPLDPASDNPWSTGLPVNFTSSNPNVATIQATGIFIWDGSSAPGIAIPVTAVGPGTTVLHASGANIPDVSTTVSVVAR